MNTPTNLHPVFDNIFKVQFPVLYETLDKSGKRLLGYTQSFDDQMGDPMQALQSIVPPITHSTKSEVSSHVKS